MPIELSFFGQKRFFFFLNVYCAAFRLRQRLRALCCSPQTCFLNNKQLSMTNSPTPSSYKHRDMQLSCQCTVSRASKSHITETTANHRIRGWPVALFECSYLFPVLILHWVQSCLNLFSICLSTSELQAWYEQNCRRDTKRKEHQNGGK